ncbi:MAG TPA: D-alanyl-D-alanine carboxypeptidase [Solirubrobacteraceae bacterium]|nr:D-alanyl-D-alanine carboxypeptidase [Solirubrobacteraceae bacterium]
MVVGIVVAIPALLASTALGRTGGEAALRSALAAQMAQGPRDEGAYVVDLGTGHVVFSDRRAMPLPTASLMKLFTTSTALSRLGSGARLSTRVFATGARRGHTWTGDLYLRGGGDFTFGTRSFDRGAYGAGGTVQSLAAKIRRSGVRTIRGSVYGDASLFTDGTGSPFELVLCAKPLFGSGCPYGPGGHFERPIPNGPRTAISFDRGLANANGAKPQRQPVGFAARALVAALRVDGVKVTGRAGARSTPPLTTQIAQTRSPKLSRLVAFINRPSDNYAADVMLRDLGARLEGQGSGVAGAIAVTDTMRRFGLRLQIESGSGETIEDKASPRAVTRLLVRMRHGSQAAAFRHSLSQAGRNGTLRRLAGTVAAGRCALKDGTRVDQLQSRNTLNISGYCRSVGGRRFAFAVMMTGMPIKFVPPDQLVSPAYALEDQIVKDLAGYHG